MSRSAIYIPFLFFSIGIASVYSIIDFPVAIGISLILIVCFLYAKIGSRVNQNQRYSIFAIVSFFYIVSSVITSTCFSEVDFYLASDPIRYIATAHRSFDYQLINDELTKCYLNLSDNNGLYNSIIRFLGIICNRSNTIASPLLMTLPQTLFGILSIQTLFRILSRQFEGKTAYRYTLIFSFCSLFFLYSGIIVRDILIAFSFIICLEVVLQPFRISGLLILILMMVFCIGIRLFSGLFISLFIIYYLFFNIKNQRLRFFLYPILLVVLVVIASSAFADSMFSKTNDEIDTYTQWQSEASSSSDGFSSSLRRLPKGLSNIALFLYSQMNPFPPYSTLLYDDISIPQAYMSVLMTVTAIWWFFISYSVLYLFILKKGYKRLPFRFSCLLLISWLLILVSSTMHVDIRRLMPVYPIIFFIYLYFRFNIYPSKIISIVSKRLAFVYIGLNLVYLIIK